jgi:N-acetylmuramoyl-L-alanine amidase
MTPEMQAAHLPRAVADLFPSLPRSAPFRDIDLIVVHCSATPPKMNIGRDEIYRWHRDKGWLDIGYHFVIRRSEQGARLVDGYGSAGLLEKGRPLWQPGAHVEGFNRNSIGICLVGGVAKAKAFLAEDNFLPEQKATLLTLLYQLRALFPATRIRGHRDLNPDKDCPSFDVRRWLLAQEFNPEPRT